MECSLVLFRSLLELLSGRFVRVKPVRAVEITPPVLSLADLITDHQSCQSSPDKSICRKACSNIATGIALQPADIGQQDRKSTRLNSSHVAISYAVFCLKKKTKRQQHSNEEQNP